jgi:hypothetical protein
MSASSISRAANDPQLQARVIALANKQVVYDEALGETWYGLQVRSGFANFANLYWPVAVATEVEYETAENSGRGAPGYDQDVIEDGAITSAIVAHWPPNPNPTLPAPAAVVEPAP